MDNCNPCIFTSENKEAKPPFNCHFHMFDSKFEENIMKRLIGKEGYYFKNITVKFKLRYVWYDKESGQIQIWGSNPKIFEFVKKYILNRVYSIIRNDINNGSEISKSTKEWFNDYKK